MDEDKLFDKLDSIKRNADHSLWCLLFFISGCVMHSTQQENIQELTKQMHNVNTQLQIMSDRMDTITINGVKFVR